MPRRRSEVDDLRGRFDAFAGRFREKSEGAPAPPPSPALDEDYWKSVRDLFTRDVTAKGFTELFAQETRDTFQFFTREVDLAGIERRVWYERYPLSAWKVFLAVAHRLSPWRRVLFASAVPILLIAWSRHLIAPSGGALLLVTASVLFFLLVLELRDKLGLKGDLEIARQIQFGLLPFEPFSHGVITIVSAMRPANTVGGDYFDVIELGDDRVAIVVGDVAGKGMPAALLMALLQGSLRTLLTAGLRGPELLAKLNAHLCANIPSNRLITLFYGELHTGSGRLRYVNAGHNPPLRLPKGAGALRLEATAMALGVSAEAVFEEREVSLGPGDRVFLFTDGVTEAVNARDEEYGEARLEAYVCSRFEAPHRELIDGVFEDVLRFCGPVRPRDDMTVMSVGRA